MYFSVCTYRTQHIPGESDLETEYEFVSDPDWEIDRRDLRLSTTLGSGAFGRVVLAKKRPGNQLERTRRSDPTPLAESSTAMLQVPLVVLQYSSILEYVLVYVNKCGVSSLREQEWIHVLAAPFY